MRAQKVNALIFTAYQDTQPDSINRANFEWLKQRLTAQDIAFKEVVGCYKGVVEPSLVLSAKHRVLVQHVCESFGQESFLEQSLDGSCSLQYRDGSVQELGELRAISESEALRSEFYTFDPSTKTYYRAV